MITRLYYGWLCDNDLIKRGDYSRIAEICQQKQLKGIEGGEVDRTSIRLVVVDGSETTQEIVEEIVTYFQQRHNLVLKQKEIVNS